MCVLSSLLLSRDLLGEPIEPFVQTSSGEGGSSLTEPRSTLDALEVELLNDFRYWHNSEILLVGEDQKNSVSKILFLEHLVELLLGETDTVSVRGVDHEDETLSSWVVVSPENSDLVLSTDVPDVELDVLEDYGFNVETNGWDGVQDLSEFELINNGGLSGSIKTKHEDSGLFLSEHSVEHFSEGKSHFSFFFEFVIFLMKAGFK